MLCSLELENFILFEKARFEFSPGLNAVSGETGAGKSLVARALALALGGRGGQDAIRAGCEAAKVRAIFRIERECPEPAAPDGRIVLERVIRRDGGGGMTVNGKPASAQAVRTRWGSRVDFAAQNERVRLADPAYQAEILDAYGRLETSAAAYRELFRNAESLRNRLNAGREERELVRLRLERARGELDMLREAGFDPAADLSLENDIRELSHSAAVVQAAGEAMAAIEGGEPSVIDALIQAKRVVERMAGASPRLREAGGRLAAGLEAVREATAVLTAAGESEAADPRRLDTMIERSERLKNLGRRFGCGVEGLEEARKRIEAEVARLSEWDSGDDETRRRLDALLPEVAEAGLALGRKRREAAKRLARAVNRELADLGMAQTGFEVVFEPLWTPAMPAGDILTAGAAGLDGLGFYISPNPGEAASAMAGAASGGEASRAALALKAALSRVHRPELVFLDEIDSGVGSRLGSELGKKLALIAENGQVIVITHLPQITAHAATHIRVAKRVRGGRTAARVEKLEGRERVEEMARMIHGCSAGEVTREQARLMLIEGGHAETP